MHAFMLILMIAGQPEHAVAICETYKQCSDNGDAVEQQYESGGGNAKDFSYRVVPVLIIPDKSQGTNT